MLDYQEEVQTVLDAEYCDVTADAIGHHALAEIMSAFGDAKDFGSSITACMKAIDQYTHFSAISLFRLNCSEECLELIDSIGFSEAAVEAAKKLSLTDSLTGQTIGEKRVITMDDIAHDARMECTIQHEMSKQGRKMLISVPLILHGNAVGAMNLVWDTHLTLLDKERKTLMQIGHALAIAVEHEQRHFESSHDSLTGLHSRREFDFRIRHLVELSRRYGNNLSLLWLDVDNFKQCNDTHGHLVGDEALKRLAKYINLSLRKCDFAFRYGGDEFVIILPETGEKGAGIVAERICNQYKSQRFISENNEVFHLSLSIGVAQYNHHAKEPITTLISRADSAMYEAKCQGKNQVVNAP